VVSFTLRPLYFLCGRKEKSVKNKNIIMGLDGAETKEGYAGEDHQQFNGLDWTEN
jgi:hypothetical protein